MTDFTENARCAGVSTQLTGEEHGRETEARHNYKSLGFGRKVGAESPSGSVKRGLLMICFG